MYTQKQVDELRYMPIYSNDGLAVLHIQHRVLASSAAQCHLKIGGIKDEDEVTKAAQSTELLHESSAYKRIVTPIHRPLSRHPLSGDLVSRQGRDQHAVLGREGDARTRLQGHLP